MKILVLSDDFPPEVAGGAGMMAFRISREFARKGHEVLVVAATGNPSGEGESRFEGMAVQRIFSKYHPRWRSYISLRNPRVVSKLGKIISDFNPDVVHAHNVHEHISYASLSTARKYAKVFLTAHDVMSFYPGTFTEFIDPKDFSCPNEFNYKVGPIMQFKKFRWRYNPLRNFFIKKELSKTNRIVAVSDELRTALLQNGIGNSMVIRNGIDLALWNASPAKVDEFKKTFALENSDIILFGGRLSGAKGGDIILRAMEIIAKKNTNAKLLVVGRKDFYSERMKRRAESLGIKDKIVFTGWLDENLMKMAYEVASVVAVPSVCFDSFPNGNLEAFASGKPVVSTCFGGSREIVKNRENGFLVNPLDVNKLSEAIVELLNDKEKARRFGEAGRKLVSENYSIVKIAGEYISLFSE